MHFVFQHLTAQHQRNVVSPQMKKEFSKWFEFVFLFTLGKNSIFIMLCKFLLRLRVWEWLIDFRYINKHLATHCQNFVSSNKKYSYNCWWSKIQFSISQTVKRIHLLKMFCPVRVYTVYKTLLPVTTADCHLYFIASSTSRADRYLLFLCHWWTLFYIKRFQSWPKKQKLNEIAWAFLRLHEWKKFRKLERTQSSNNSNNLCNATDRQKVFVLFFLSIRLTSD